MAKSKSQSSESTKAERKFEKKLEFYSKVRNRVADLNAQKTITKKKRLRSRQKNLKAYDFSSLSEVLPELNALEKKPKTLADIKLNCKSRSKIMLKEAKQWRIVLNDPMFQSDPLAAIHLHLQSTQPVVDEKPKRKDKSGETDKKKKKKKKSKGKKKSESSAGHQAMDI